MEIAGKSQERKYVELVFQMSADCLQGGVTFGTWLDNLKGIVNKLKCAKKGHIEEPGGYEVWLQAYVATGTYGSPQYLGMFKAGSFREAVIRAVKHSY